jgi:hypothetical protein
MEDEDYDLSSIIASDHSPPPQSLHDSTSTHHHRLHQSPQNVIGISPHDRQERITSFRQAYGTNFPKSNIVLVLPSTDKRKEPT